MAVPKARTTHADVTPAHTQKFTHTCHIHYPEHGPRESDPHYHLFDAYRRATKDSARCAWAVRTGVDGECDGGLELHHAHLEQAMLNAADHDKIRAILPGLDLSDDDAVSTWAEGAQNLTWLCVKHHRSAVGVHQLSASDYEASHYVLAGTITA